MLKRPLKRRVMRQLVSTILVTLMLVLPHSGCRSKKARPDFEINAKSPASESLVLAKDALNERGRVPGFYEPTRNETGFLDWTRVDVGDTSQATVHLAESRIGTDEQWYGVRDQIACLQIGEVISVGGGPARVVAVVRTSDRRLDFGSRVGVELVHATDGLSVGQPNGRGCVAERGVVTAIRGLMFIWIGRISVTDGEPVADLFDAEPFGYGLNAANQRVAIPIRAGYRIRRRDHTGAVAEYRVREIILPNPLHQLRGWVTLDCVRLDEAAETLAGSFIDPIAAAAPFSKTIELSPLPKPDPGPGPNE